jgi:hypothetical protein
VPHRESILVKQNKKKLLKLILATFIGTKASKQNTGKYVVREGSKTTIMTTGSIKLQTNVKLNTSTVPMLFHKATSLLYKGLLYHPTSPGWTERARTRPLYRESQQGHFSQTPGFRIV